MRDSLGSAVIGVLFGFSLSRIGFSSWDEVHRMFTFADLRLFLTFVGAVVVLSIGWPVVSRLACTIRSSRLAGHSTACPARIARRTPSGARSIVVSSPAVKR